MSAALALLCVAFATLAVVYCLRLVHKARGMAAALEESQLRYQQLVEQIPGVLYVIELGEGTRQSGRCTSARASMRSSG
jgi:hypothetical protein